MATLLIYARRTLLTKAILIHDQGYFVKKMATVTPRAEIVILICGCHYSIHILHEDGCLLLEIKILQVPVTCGTRSISVPKP